MCGLPWLPLHTRGDDTIDVVLAARRIGVHLEAERAKSGEAEITDGPGTPARLEERFELDFRIVQRLDVPRELEDDLLKLCRDRVLVVETVWILVSRSQEHHFRRQMRQFWMGVVGVPHDPGRFPLHTERPDPFSRVPSWTGSGRSRRIDVRVAVTHPLGWRQSGG